VARLVFDIADDHVGYWRVYGRGAGQAREIAATEAAYLRGADAVVAVSSVLIERLRGAGYEGPISLIPNGVWLNAYDPHLGNRIRSRYQLGGPIIGLIGNHDKRTELASALEVADRLRGTGATVLVVGRGSALGWAQAAARQRQISNIRFTGLVPPEEIGAFFAAVDVGLCPYARNPASDASSPMRVISHCAAGSQVVCTELEEVRRMNLANVTLVENTPEAFARAVREMLGRPRMRTAGIEKYDLARLVADYTRVLGIQARSNVVHSDEV
jgi:teichuronic acid biosynthesis glycosyltransferase TuaH